MFMIVRNCFHYMLLVVMIFNVFCLLNQTNYNIYSNDGITEMGPNVIISFFSVKSI